MILSPTRAELALLMSSIATDGYDAASLWMMLFTDGPSVSPPVLYSDFTTPALADLVRVSLDSWSPPDYQPDGSYQVTTPVLSFRFAVFTVPTNFTGAALVNSLTVGSVMAWGLFDEILQLLTYDSYLKFVIRLTVKLDSTVVVDVIRIDG